MNYYEILEVSPKASQEVIKAAYKSLMQRYHPDRNPDNAAAAEHSVLVVQAYEVLSDSGKRAVYDSELKLQSESLNSVQVRARNILASASLDDRDSGTRWWLWLLIALIVTVLFWFVFSPSGKKQSFGIEPQDVGSLLGSLGPDSQQGTSNVHAIPVEARTISAYIKDLNVKLEVPAESKATLPVDPRYVLSIQTIGVVAGTFDPDKFISFMENNKEYIGQKLAEKLAVAKYDMLIRHDGDQYLKRVILDSIGEITDTNRFEEFPSSGTEPPARYGAVDILLPDSFTVKTQQSGQ